MRRTLAAAVTALAVAGPGAGLAVAEEHPPPEGTVVFTVGDKAVDRVAGHGAVRVTGTLAGPGLDRAQLRLRLSPEEAVPVGGNPQGGSIRTAVWDFTTLPCAEGQAAPDCGAAAVVANGPRVVEVWKVGVDGRDSSDKPTASGTVVLDVPAGQPHGVTAKLEGRTVTVTWARTGRFAVKDSDPVELTEPDVVWQVSDGEGLAVAATPADCDGGTCSARLSYAGSSGGPRSYTVTASRPCTGCTNASTASAPSEQLTVPVVVPPRSRPPSAGSPPAAGTGTAARPVGPRRSGFSTFTPGLGPLRPPTGSPSAPSVAAPELPDTFEQTLDYDQEQQTYREPVIPEASSGSDSTVLTSTGGLLQSEQVMRGVAAAMLLGLSGAHLRTWLARARLESEDL